jgi:hypothetical protein
MSLKTEKQVPKAFEPRAPEPAQDRAANAYVASKTRDDLRLEPSPGVPATDIFINCPNTGVPVGTGLATRSVVFSSLPPVAVPLCCPACGQVHKWKPQDAWIGLPLQPSDRPARLACVAT